MGTEPFQKAFIVQFVERAGESSARFVGRIEHLDSGRTGHFGSRKELLDVLAAMLREASPDPSDEKEATRAKPPARRPGDRTK